MKTFQTLFPPLAPHKLALSSARRVVLVAYNADRGTIDWRHFRITVKPYGVSRRVRRVLQGTGATVRPAGGGNGGAVLDLGNEKDVADYVLRAHGRGGGGGGASVDGGGYETAASEVSSVAEGTDAEDIVSLAEDYVGRNNRKGQKRAVQLDEIGPRMELRLVKITEGVPGKEGAVIYHQFGEWRRSGGDSTSSTTRVEKAHRFLFYFFSQEDQDRNCSPKRMAFCSGKVEKRAS